MSRRLKVALMFFGQPRFLRNPFATLSHQKHILDKYDTQVFCHAWFDKEKSELAASSWSTLTSSPIEPDAPLRIIKAYNPKLLSIEKPINFNVSPEYFEMLKSKLVHEPAGIVTQTNFSNICSGLYSNEYVARMTAQRGEFDFIISSRYDNLIYRLPDLNTLSPDRFYVSDHHPRFPDLLFICGKKFLPAFHAYSELSKSIKENLDQIWTFGFEPLRFLAFARQFDPSLITPVSLPVRVVRDNANKGDESLLERYRLTAEERQIA